MTNTLPAHSQVGASSMHRWANCPGSVRLSRGIKSESSLNAIEGTVAHKVAEILLTSSKSVAGAVFHEQGESIVVTQDMLDAVNVYVSEVHKRKKRGDTLLIEHKFHLKDLHPGLFGTADCVLWSPKAKHLTVIDYKHGAGVPVDATDNEQLKYYALGALLTLEYAARRVTVAIVQPRCPHADGPVREQTFDAVELLDFAADLVEAVKRTEAPDAPLLVGDWCRWCPAAGCCPAQAANAQQIAKVSFASPVKLPPAPDTLPIEQVATILERLPVLESWIKSVREYAYTQAESGVDVPRHKLVAKLAHRKLKAEIDAEALAAASGGSPADFLTEPELMGVTAIEKLMPGKNAAERAAALEPFVLRESTGHVLVHASDKRPAVNPQSAAKLAFTTTE